MASFHGSIPFGLGRLHTPCRLIRTVIADATPLAFPKGPRWVSPVPGSENVAALSTYRLDDHDDVHRTAARTAIHTRRRLGIAPELQPPPRRLELLAVRCRER
jgi:hypothetical protein